MQKTTIFEVTAYSGANPVQYFFGTSLHAKIKAQAMRSENYTDVKIRARHIALNSEGIAQALQGLVDLYCLNEH